MKNTAVQLARNNSKMLIAGSVILIGGVWISVAIIQHRQTVRDQKAVAFFSELQRDIAPDTVGLVESNAFNIRYWEETGKRLKKPLIMLTGASASAFAKDIKNSWSVFGDDENKIKSVFRALKDQVQVSQMAYQYYMGSTDRINLIDDLKSRLSKEEVGEVLDIVKKMPPYRLVEPSKKKMK